MFTKSIWSQSKFRKTWHHLVVEIKIAHYIPNQVHIHAHIIPKASVFIFASKKKYKKYIIDNIFKKKYHKSFTCHLSKAGQKWS